MKRYAYVNWNEINKENKPESGREYLVLIPRSDGSASASLATWHNKGDQVMLHCKEGTQDALDKDAPVAAVVLKTLMDIKTGPLKITEAPEDGFYTIEKTNESADNDFLECLKRVDKFNCENNRPVYYTEKPLPPEGVSHIQDRDLLESNFVKELIKEAVECLEKRREKGIAAAKEVIAENSDVSEIVTTIIGNKEISFSETAQCITENTTNTGVEEKVYQIFNMLAAATCTENENENVWDVPTINVVQAAICANLIDEEVFEFVNRVGGTENAAVVLQHADDQYNIETNRIADKLFNALEPLLSEEPYKDSITSVGSYLILTLMAHLATGRDADKSIEAFQEIYSEMFKCSNEIKTYFAATLTAMINELILISASEHAHLISGSKIDRKVLLTRTILAFYVINYGFECPEEPTDVA